MGITKCDVRAVTLTLRRLNNASSSYCTSAPCGAGAPLFPLVHLLPYLFPFLLFPFSRWLYLFSSFVIPSLSTRKGRDGQVSRLEVVGGDRTWVFVLFVLSVFLSLDVFWCFVV